MGDKFQLGVRVREIVSGFEGIVTGRAEYLNGCVQYLVRPKMVVKEGDQPKAPDGVWYDEQYLELVDPGLLHERHPTAVRAAGETLAGARTGSDAPAPSAPGHG